VSIRTERISEQIKNEISVVLRDEISDPRISLLTITRVNLSKDLSHARIFWSPLVADPDGLDDMEDGLSSASGYVRKQLAKRLNLRRTPALEFRFDPSIEEGSRILSLIQTLDDGASPEAEEGTDARTGDDDDGKPT
jgi:ribosome-binding factor A